MENTREEAEKDGYGFEEIQDSARRERERPNRTWNHSRRPSKIPTLPGPQTVRSASETVRRADPLLLDELRAGEDGGD